jgi:hypothetical protein
MAWSREAMFFRVKTTEGRSYLQIVESHREFGRVRQRVLLNLGRLDRLVESGELDRLLASGARFCEQFGLLQELDQGLAEARLSCRRIGGPLLFGRLWAETGIAAVLAELLADRRFELAVERAVFVTVLHRLFAPGSDRACEKWLADYRIDGAEGLALHQLYRAMAWLGEELDQEVEATTDTGPRAPLCVKDLIEERLFARRRDLFSELSVVFMDTTSLYFTGAGGESLGARGYSKDHRPELMQMILGLVVDGQGRPICTEMWPGNTADVTVLLPMVERLQKRFALARVCVVADRGMISKATIAALEERGLEFILGARERSDPLVREVVLADQAPFVSLAVPKGGVKGAKETVLEAKVVTVDGRRHVVCRNQAQAKKDAADRAEVLAGLERQLARGDKSLVGNAAYRRFLKAAGPRFAIDHDKARDEARFDGITVLRTNTSLAPLQAMLRYRELLRVEDLFRQSKSLLRTRPIYHSSDAAIRGHVFCSFLALVLKKELMQRCRACGETPEWLDVKLDLDRLQEASITRGERSYTLRTEATGCTAALFKAVRIALPPRLVSDDPARAKPRPTDTKCRRGRPRRSARAS